MALRYLMDVHVPRTIAVGLRRRGIEVITAVEDGSDELDDLPLLERAGVLGCILFTQDQDFLAIAAQLQAEGRSFPAIVFLEQQKTLVGRAVDDLEILAQVLTAGEIASEVVFLPL